MINIKLYLLIALVVLGGHHSISQETLSIEKAYLLAIDNYPLMKSLDIYSAIEDSEIQLIEQSRKPIISVHGQATIQSEAVNIGTDIPNSPISIDAPLYRAQAYGNISYNLYDGGVSEVKKQINRLQTQIREKQLLVDTYPIKAQVNKLFTGILLGQNILKLYEITENDLIVRKEVLSSGVNYGTVLESEVTKLAVRLIELANEKRQVQADIISGYATLSVLLGMDLSPETRLIIPENIDIPSDENIIRPESDLFDQQKMALRTQEELIDRLDKPQINFFSQVGIAYPNNLNFSQIELAPFALAGVGVSYKLFDKKNKSIKKQKLVLEEELIDIKEETFTQQIKLQKAGYAEEFRSLNFQIAQYENIALLQQEILDQLRAQLDNGIITSTDYLIQANAELSARQNLELTKIRLQQKKLEYLHIIGQ